MVHVQKQREIMSIEELMALRNSSEAPFNHQEYTVWLHDRIVKRIQYDLMQHLEKCRERLDINSWAACNKIMALPSLQKAD